MKMDDDMELMELWIENVRGWEEMRVSRKDFVCAEEGGG